MRNYKLNRQIKGRKEENRAWDILKRRLIKAIHALPKYSKILINCTSTHSMVILLNPLQPIILHRVHAACHQVGLNSLRNSWFLEICARAIMSREQTQANLMPTKSISKALKKIKYKAFPPSQISNSNKKSDSNSLYGKRHWESWKMATILLNTQRMDLSLTTKRYLLIMKNKC